MNERPVQRAPDPDLSEQRATSSWTPAFDADRQGFDRVEQATVDTYLAREKAPYVGANAGSGNVQTFN